MRSVKNSAQSEPIQTGTVGDTLFEAARFFRRRIFEELEGYDEEITGSEDYDIQARLERRN